MTANLLLEEQEGLSKEDLIAKINRLEGYIAKVDNRIRTHERALENIKNIEAKKMGLSDPVIRGKIYG